MASVHEVIEALRTAPSNAERGVLFEHMMVRYFQLDPQLSQEYEQVWRWADWPGRDGKPDTGIDLVARRRGTGEYAAIQCKFYEPDHQLAKADIDSFFTASGKAPFTHRVIISTTDKWSTHAEDALDGQSIPVSRVGLEAIADSPIDWNITWAHEAGLPTIELEPAKKHQPRTHQQEAIDAVFRGYAAGNERGKMIMACGTGKTFTALKIAERTAAEHGGTARIVFAVPSIALLSQTLREWTAQTELDMRAFAVCSDTKVSRAAEDIGTSDVGIPVTTRPHVLADEMGHRKRAAGLTVVFMTYQSLPVVAQAQNEHGVDPFDLVIADEAHRTTGVTVAGADESHFVRIHDGDYLHADRRLYMTATPRIYDNQVKDKAVEHSAELTSMDDEAKYGPELHRLGFGEAVNRGLLTDYKVLVLTVDENHVAGPLQEQIADGTGGELALDDASKLIGCWNGLAKRAGDSPEGPGFLRRDTPMRRAVAFARDIKTSKQVTDLFPAVTDSYRRMLQDRIEDGAEVSDQNLGLRLEARHVDGTYNALDRSRQLRWLKAPVDDECRILSNARCLSEGVDVPALDAVMFLHPRNSQVDVVQAVGRVMRKAEGKNYGYIILPVAVPAGVSPAQALSDNKRFKVVWDVLNALRANDDRFDAMINSIALNKSSDEPGAGTDQLLGAHIGPTSDDHDTSESDGEAKESVDDTARQMALFSLSDWQEAIYTRIVDKVGTRTYWEDWAKDVADIAHRLTVRIEAVLDRNDPAVTAGFDDFLTGLRENLNDQVSRDDAVSMLAQHLITKPVFDALFTGSTFADSNPVAQAMQAMVDTLGQAGLEAETAQLDRFYASVRTRAAEVTTAEGKQQVIADLYERFFRLGFSKQADALGIVYTPTEIVDFILRAADQASREAFGKGITDEGVHLLDPFTGTGTFLTRLLQSGLINPHDLARKYAAELHANELMLLAYYIAAVNIETTYHALTEQPDYEPFEGVVLADTFALTGRDGSLDADIFPENNHRITNQQAADINIIVGNPPYSVGQTSANDLNANVSYPALDARITDTYAARSTAQLKRSLYDSYLRGFRWATDRIGQAGIVAFVSNGGWLEGNTADGIRLSLQDEYARIYVYNLRGNQRTAGELSRKEGGKIFGSGSRSTIAVFIGVKDPAHTGPCEVLYRDIGDYLTRDDKLARIADEALDTIDWQHITPNRYGDWIGQRSDDFATWPAIGTKKPEPGQTTVFYSYSRGLATSRDWWCYNFSDRKLRDNITTTVEFYNAEADRIGPLNAAPSQVNDLITVDSTQFSWDAINKRQVIQGKKITVDPDGWRISMYRPFSTRHVYFDPRQQLNNSTYQLPSMFPTPHHTNTGFWLSAKGSSAGFTVLVTNHLPDLVLAGAGNPGQFFTRWTYEEVDSRDGGLDFGTGGGDVDEWGYRRVDNITDAIQNLCADTLGGQVSKDDIFYYVYGLLHDPDYRETYAVDLKKMLPHIPTPETRERFDQLAEAGRRLADLHTGYEHVEPYPLDVQLTKGADPQDRETWRVKKMRWSKRTDPETGKKIDDKTTIVYNPQVTITGIPPEADRYMLGARSALAWILDRYQVKTDKASGIVSDPNDWCDEHDQPTYIVDLIKRVTTVAVETMRIVDTLSEGGA